MINGYGEIKFVQNFIGCHDSKYPQDFLRRFDKLKKRSPEPNDFIEGVINNHDYNLLNNNDYCTLKCIENLLNYERSSIVSFENLGLNYKIL